MAAANATLLERERSLATAQVEFARVQSLQQQVQRQLTDSQAKIKDDAASMDKMSDEITSLYKRCGVLERRLAGEEAHKNKALKQCKHLTEQLQASVAQLHAEAKHIAEVSDKEKRALQTARAMRERSGEAEARLTALETALTKTLADISARDQVSVCGSCYCSF